MGDAEYEDAGLLDSGSPKAAERLELLEHLAGLGVSVEDMQRAAADGLLYAAGSEAAIRPGRRMTMHAAAQAVGIGGDDLRKILVAAGVRVDDDLVTESDIAPLQLFALGAALFGTEPTLRFTRAVGSSMARVADAAIATFLVGMGDLANRDDANELELAVAGESAVSQLDSIPDVMGALFRMHAEEAVRRQRLSVAEGPAMFRLTIGFVDLVGFTPLARELAPEELGELVEGLEMIASEVVGQSGGRVVKHIGDEVMFASVDAAQGAHIAIQLVGRFSDRHGVAPHAGLAHGVVLGRGGDFYGSVVNLASRLADVAVSDEILVTEEMVRAAESDVTLRFEPAGSRMIKGYDEPIELWSLS